MNDNVLNVTRAKCYQEVGMRVPRELVEALVKQFDQSGHWETVTYWEEYLAAEYGE